jgi:hydroxymethylglutaryl-CoA lyase
MKRVPRDDAVSYIGLALNERGYQRAIAASVDEVNFVVVVSDTFSRRNQGVGTDESIKTWRTIARAARADGVRATVTLAAVFGCPFEGEVSLARFRGICAEILEERPDELALADTIGVGVPTQVRERVEVVRELDPDLRLRCHFHNTRNTGLANAVAAVEAGVDTLDASIGGIGGCPFAPGATGNVPTEDLVYLLERMGHPTGLELDDLCATAKWLGDRLGTTVPGLLGRAGGFPPPT